MWTSWRFENSANRTVERPSFPMVGFGNAGAGPTIRIFVNLLGSREFDPVGPVVDLLLASFVDQERE